jgi:D-3-phosphoglycerate dehydrogenase / 2-oxoglutarate reductase
MQKVLITAPVHPWLPQILQDKGFEVVLLPAITYEQVVACIHEYAGLVITTRILVDEAVLNNAHQLQWIARLGSGMELINVALATSKGITCVSSPEGNSNAVAEHSLGMLLSLANNLVKSSLEIKNGQWLRNENRGWELSGKTVGIIGYGHTGAAFAKLLQGWNVQVLAHDILPKQPIWPHVKMVSKQEVLAHAQVVSLHLPLTAETKYYANDSFFNSLQQKPLFISCCRGKVTHTAALIQALNANVIRGAALDVLENEQLHTYTAEQQNELNWLLAQPNVLITPHIAGYTHEAYLQMAKVVVEKLGL